MTGRAPVSLRAGLKLRLGADRPGMRNPRFQPGTGGIPPICWGMLDLNVLSLALAKAIVPNAGRPAPGAYSIDHAIRLAGTVKVGEDYSQRVSASIPWKELAAVAILRSGLSPADLLADIAAADLADLTARTEHVSRELALLLGAASVRPCKGKVTGKVVAVPE